MADFCKQCSIALFNEDLGDFRNAGAPDTFEVCEGCGPTVVNADGECVSMWCEKHFDAPNDYVGEVRKIDSIKGNGNA